ncbi:MAG: glycoside hydrolase family 43 protein [Prevotella sp.]|nr:glycoside hydrolase family 43 protein [Prevotella sp.]
MEGKHYLVPEDYMADPSVHVWNDKLYIYPSHDRESGIAENDNGDHFDMNDYHVFSTDDIEAVARGEASLEDHGVILRVSDIPWAGRQLWDCDVQEKDGKYYLYFPLKDRNDIFRFGVAVSDRPEGPFTPQPDPMRGSYSIDVAVLKDDTPADGSGKPAYYFYFGGIWGGQLQRYKDNKALEAAHLPEGEEPALPSRVARLSDDMLQFAEEPQPVLVVDSNGEPLKANDPHRFFEASWVHKYNGKYYLSYSTGDTHLICYAISDSPYGPFTYKGVILTPVKAGWTTHHCIVEFKGKWYLFHHDSVPSGKTWLRSLKVCELHYNADGTIQTIEG